jgi:hypothetical protein
MKCFSMGYLSTLFSLFSIVKDFSEKSALNLVRPLPIFEYLRLSVSISICVSLGLRILSNLLMERPCTNRSHESVY